MYVIQEAGPFSHQEFDFGNWQACFTRATHRPVQGGVFYSNMSGISPKLWNSRLPTKSDPTQMSPITSPLNSPQRDRTIDSQIKPRDTTFSPQRNRTMDAHLKPGETTFSSTRGHSPVSHRVDSQLKPRATTFSPTRAHSLVNSRSLNSYLGPPASLKNRKLPIPYYPSPPTTSYTPLSHRGFQSHLPSPHLNSYSLNSPGMQRLDSHPSQILLTKSLQTLSTSQLLSTESTSPRRSSQNKKPRLVNTPKHRENSDELLSEWIDFQLMNYKYETPRDEHGPWQITKFLYIGNSAQACEVGRRPNSSRITAILNVSDSDWTSSLPLPNDFPYLFIPIKDSGTENLLLYLDRCVKFIEDQVRRSHCVLVHCTVGINRSASCCLAYLITCENQSLIPALKFIQQQRGTSIIQNMAFRKQLIQYYKGVTELRDIIRGPQASAPEC